MKLRFLALGAATAIAACGGDVVSTNTRGAEGVAGTSTGGSNPGTSVAGSAGGNLLAGAGGTTSAGGSASSSAGAAGVGGSLGLAGGPPAEAPLLITRPGRPHSLVVDGDELRWILAKAGGDFTGPVESIALAGGEVRTLFPAEPGMAAFSSLPNEPYVYASGWVGTGGIRRISKAGGSVEIVLEDPEPAFDLAVVNQVAYRVRGGEHSESWVERIDLVSGAATRVSQAEQLDAYIGDFHCDGTNLFWTMQAFGGESGLYRAPLDGGSQQMLTTGSDDDIGLGVDDVFRVRRGVEANGPSFLLDAIPKLGGALRSLSGLTAAGLGRSCALRWPAAKSRSSSTRPVRCPSTSPAWPPTRPPCSWPVPPTAPSARWCRRRPDRSLADTGRPANVVTPRACSPAPASSWQRPILPPTGRRRWSPRRCQSSSRAPSPRT